MCDLEVTAGQVNMMVLASFLWGWDYRFHLINSVRVLLLDLNVQSKEFQQGQKVRTWQTIPGWLCFSKDDMVKTFP